MLALPFLESFAARAARAAGASASAVSAAATPPLRMGIFTVTGGTVLESWKMKSGGSLASGKLPSILRSLEFAKDDMLLLTGLSHNGRTEGLNGHEGAAFLHLTGAPEAKKVGGKAYASVSVDQVAAKAVGDDTYLPSLELGMSNGETKFSFRGPDQSVPYEANPRLVFERMFRGRKPVVPNWNNRATKLQGDVQRSAKPNSAEQSVIDLVNEESKDLRRVLGKGDQHKLEEYLASVRSVEQRIAFAEARQRQEAMDLLKPGPSKLDLPANLPAAGLPIWKILQPVNQDPEHHANYIRLMADLFVLAFQTDTTRVATLAIGDDGAMFPGVVTVGYERHCHTLEHQGNAGRVEDADPIAREACRQIHAWYTSFVGEMVAKMKAIDEGNGTTLLDNSMLLYTSYMADGGHGRNDYPALLIGKAGGTLKTGRQVTYQNKTPMSNLYVEMLNRMGAKVDSFGDSKTAKTAAYDGRLPGLV
jgi:hypothetical protein